MLKENERKAIEELVELAKNARHRWCRNVQIEVSAQEECDDAVTGASHISGVWIELYKGGPGSVKDISCIPSIEIEGNGKDGIETYNEVLDLLVRLGMKQTDHEPLTDIEMCGYLTGYDRFIPQEGK